MADSQAYEQTDLDYKMTRQRVIFEDPNQQQLFEERFRYWHKTLKPAREATQTSGIITESDLEIVINC